MRGNPERVDAWHLATIGCRARFQRPQRAIDLACPLPRLEAQPLCRGHRRQHVEIFGGQIIGIVRRVHLHFGVIVRVRQRLFRAGFQLGAEQRIGPVQLRRRVAVEIGFEREVRASRCLCDLRRQLALLRQARHGRLDRTPRYLRRFVEVEGHIFGAEDLLDPLLVV